MVNPISPSSDPGRQNLAPVDDNPYVDVVPVENPGRNTGQNNAWNEPPSPGELKRTWDALSPEEQQARADIAREGRALVAATMAAARQKRGK